MTEQSIGTLAADIVNRLAAKTGRPKPFAVDMYPITDRAIWLELRKRDVTASAAAALLGVHPYQTAYSMWAEKTGVITTDDEMTEAMERGIELEPLAVRRIRKKHPTWIVEQPNTYYRDPAARLGATPDAFAQDPERDGFGVVQIKSVEPSKFRKTWRNEEGETEPPVWIVIQAIIEAELTGASWAAVAALVIGYGIDLHLVDVPLHRGVIDRVRAEVAAFWRTVEEGRTPDPDFNRDYALIERLFDPSAPQPLDLCGDNALPELLDEKDRLASEKTAAEARLKAIKAELLTKLDGHGAALCADGRIVTARRTKRKAYQVKETEYVDVRIKRQLERRA